MNTQRATRSTALFAIMLWGVAAAAPLVRSQGAGQGENRPAIQTLTDDGLRQMLDNMGYEPKKLSKGFLIALKRDTWTYNIQLLLSPDKTKLGYNANMGTVENPDSIPAEQWKKLLVSNGDIDPSFFYLDKDSKKLYLHRTVDNRGIEPSFMRQQIENFCSNIKDTSELWKFTK